MARRTGSRKAPATPQPGSFSERFTRVTASKTAKHYYDRNTGETIPYRQALKRAKEGQLTRRAPSVEHKARVRAGIQRRASIRNSILKRLGLTGAEAKASPQIDSYIKFMTKQSKKGSTGFSRGNSISVEDFESDFDQDFGDAIDDYDDYIASLGPVGGFISG